MTLTLHDFPEDLLAGLKRRAKQLGQTVEQEAIELLLDSIQPRASIASNESFAAALSRRLAEIGLTAEDWSELDRSLDAARSSRSESMHRWVDFESADFGK